jgi:hypothetical protein
VSYQLLGIVATLEVMVIVGAILLLLTDWEAS